MQTFRAYLRDAAGVITWAAWVEAADMVKAEGEAHRLCPGGKPTVDLWSATDRRLSSSCELDPV
jgi:hypothetical protein